MLTSVHASTPSHPASPPSVPPGEELLEWRHLQSHDVPLISPRVQWLLAGGMGLLVVAYVAWMLHRAWPVLSQLDWQTLGATWWHKAREKEANWLVLVYPVLMAGILGQRWLWGRHLRLYVSAQGLRQEHRLPLGLHHLFGQNWQVDWSDVREITTRRASTTNGLVQPMAAVEIVLRLGAGRERVLRPAFWFRPGDPPRPRLKSLNSPWSSLQPWAGPENHAQLARAFAELRLVSALQRHAPLPDGALPWPGVPHSLGTDLNSQPEVLTLFGVAALVFVTGLALMVAAPHLHLHASPSFAQRAAWAVGTLALWAAAWLAWACHKASRPEPNPVSAAASTQQPSVPLFKTALALAAVLWMASVAFVIEPLLVHSALLGRGDAWRTHRFVLSSGWAKPMGAEAAHIPPIELPGAQSRVAWIKPGTEAELATVQGRWGLWIYNDAPLRELATQQGVR